MFCPLRYRGSRFYMLPNHRYQVHLFAQNKRRNLLIHSCSSKSLEPQTGWLNLGCTLPETNAAPWKLMVGILVTSFLLGRPIFRCYVSFREGIGIGSLWQNNLPFQELRKTGHYDKIGQVKHRTQGFGRNEEDNSEQNLKNTMFQSKGK